jgi:hypothetical protein
VSIAELQSQRNQGEGFTLQPQGFVMGGERSRQYIEQEPQMLAWECGVNVNVYSLARMIASEGYSGDKQTEGATAAIAICQMALNKAKRVGQDVTDVMTYHPSRDNRNDRYGRQNGGRYCSTIRDPKQWHLNVANAVWNSLVPDIVEGCHMYFDPKVQDGGKQAGTALRRDAEGVCREWIIDGGNEFVPLPGISTYNLMAFRRPLAKSLRKENFELAMQHIEKGRRGKSTLDPRDPDKYTGMHTKTAITLETLILAARKALGFG